MKQLSKPQISYLLMHAYDATKNVRYYSSRFKEFNGTEIMQMFVRDIIRILKQAL
jgi:hypothetical protein